MFLDVRWPLGAMFSIFGATIGAYGAFFGTDDGAHRLLGARIDVVWGSVLLAFGVIVLALAARARAKRGHSNAGRIS